MCFSLISVEMNHLRPGQEATEEKPLVVLVCSYNNEPYCIGNLESIFQQNYENFRVIYINDASTDRTGELVKKFIKEHNLETKITYIENPVNMKAMANTYHGIHLCDNDEIVLVVDGDDKLYGKSAMQFINKAYHDDNVWVTYGNYKKGFKPIEKSKKGCSKPVAIRILRNALHRTVGYRWSHLRTFYAGLFKRIPKQRFMYHGKFLPSGHDIAMMMNLIDLAREHTYFIDEVLYEYNRNNPIADHKIHLREQMFIGRRALKQPPLSFYCRSKDDFLSADEL